MEKNRRYSRNYICVAHMNYILKVKKSYFIIVQTNNNEIATYFLHFISLIVTDSHDSQANI